MSRPEFAAWKLARAGTDGKRAEVKLVPVADIRGIARTVIPVRRSA